MSFLRAGGTLRCIKNEPAARLRTPLIGFVVVKSQPIAGRSVPWRKPSNAAAIRPSLHINLKTTLPNAETIANGICNKYDYDPARYSTTPQLTSSQRQT